MFTTACLTSSAKSAKDGGTWPSNSGGAAPAPCKVTIRMNIQIKNPCRIDFFACDSNAPRFITNTPFNHVYDGPGRQFSHQNYPTYFALSDVVRKKKYPLRLLILHPSMERGKWVKLCISAVKILYQALRRKDVFH
jgi:hypothetical protein